MEGKIKQILRSDWLIERTSWAHLAYDFPCWSQKGPYNKFLIDQAGLFEMAVYWPSSLLHFY